MNEYDIVKEWLEIAYEDYDIARYLYDNKFPKPLEIICYHCQQSVEKSLKGYICANDIDVSQTHDLSLLCRQCSSIDESFSVFDKNCGALKVYVTRTRYPNRIEIDDYSAEKALQQAPLTKISSSCYSAAMKRTLAFFHHHHRAFSPSPGSAAF